ncbi:phosphoglycerate dehydrogenase [Bordetella ansorpii]|uniref:Phosphoglycerate dehydrogenase n=1 Tax=Bordetella ansorpii TaxID=288768 RepID=A0A157SBC1_9BORD|nr:hydroxyacid dehydrogenase [Bordetella ansorpii]SAI67664.1 phosphoglycerate dehydrogenase [Bordetella ansorpii]
MTSAKRLVRLDLWLDPIFDKLIAEHANVALTVAPARDGDPAARDALRRAHGYLVTAAKDELPSSGFVTAELIAQCPELVCVATTGAGYDTVDVAACTAAGIAVVNQAGGNADSVAEHTYALLLAVRRRIVESHQRLRHDSGFTREHLMGHQIRGNIIGLVGLGQIGSRAARIAQGFGMRVLAHDPYLPPESLRALGAEPVSLDDLLAQSDIVSLHCPLSAETRGMMDAAAFARMKPGSVFITTARGGVHDEAALYDALQSGHLAGAGLDVWKQEPPGNDAPLLQLPNVVGTYHTAGVTHEARRNVARSAAEQLLAMLAGQRPPNLVNPQAWPAALERIARLA